MRLSSPRAFCLPLLLLLVVLGLPNPLTAARSPVSSSSSSSSSSSLGPAACRSPNVRMRYQKSPVVLEARLAVPRVREPPTSSQALMHVLRVLKGETRRVVPNATVLVVQLPKGRCGHLQQGRRYFVFGETAGNTTVRALGAPLRTNVKNAKKAIRKGEQCKKCAAVRSLNGTASVTFNFQMNLTCWVTGRPKLKVTWYKDGKEISDSRVQILLKNRKMGSLRIDQVRREDAGEYECRVTNPNSSASKTFYVSVTKSPYEGKSCEIPDYCLNGGTCTYLDLGEYVCQCAEEYKGRRCEVKDPSPSNVGAESLGIDVSTRTLSLYWGK